MNVEPSHEDDLIARAIYKCALKVHQELGPGLLEKTYEMCLDHLLKKDGLEVKRQISLPITFSGMEIPNAYRLDLLVNDRVIVEDKAVESLLPIHHAQLYTYLKLLKLQVGLLINFNVKLLKQGVKRIICSPSA